MRSLLNIVFMGTPEFAVPVLNKLYENKYDISLIVTQPDRPKGRGRKVIASPVKKTALRLGYKIAQPLSIESKEFTRELKAICPDIIIVVAFGQVLPKSIIKSSRYGAINIHASLLPKYRGPAPIHWAIIDMEKETGTTTMMMDEGLDTGDILLSRKTKIRPDDTTATLHDRLSHQGAELLIQTLRQFESGTINPTPQNHAESTYAPLLKKENGRIDWHKPGEVIEAFIRGMTPWPGAFTFYGNKRLKIFKANCLINDTKEPPGTVIRGFSGELRISTGKGVLSILEIQGASGKRMLTRDFLRGNKINPGDILN